MALRCGAINLRLRLNSTHFDITLQVPSESPLSTKADIRQGCEPV